MTRVADISPTDFCQRWSAELDSGTVTLLDVREPWEVATAAVPGATLMPMGEVPGRRGELDAQQVIVVMCHGGARSAEVAQYLAGSGFEQVFNLAGGIDAWSRDVDPTIPRY